VRVGAVDLGTNTTRLLVADVDGERLDELHRETRITRLGEGVDARKRLLPVPIARVRNALSDYRRTFRNSRELLDRRAAAAEPIDAAPGQDERLGEAQARALLMRALDELPFERRVVLVMHDLDGVAVPEIAAALDIPLNTAYSRLRLARVDLTAAVRRPRGSQERG